MRRMIVAAAVQSTCLNITAAESIQASCVECHEVCLGHGIKD